MSIGSRVDPSRFLEFEIFDPLSAGYPGSPRPPVQHVKDQHGYVQQKAQPEMSGERISGPVGGAYSDSRTEGHDEGGSSILDVDVELEKSYILMLGPTGTANHCQACEQV